MTKTGHNLSIDALRAIAVMMVFFHHMNAVPTGGYLYDVFLGLFKDFGTLGVDLFFVISGFCIHGAYSQSGKPFQIKVYLRRRFWRIYPPYFFALCLALILNTFLNIYKNQSIAFLSVDPDLTWQSIVSHLFLVHNLNRETLMSVSGPFWTIALEAQFYLIYILFRPLFFSRKGWLAAVAISIVLYFVAWRVYQTHPEVEYMAVFRYWPTWLMGAYLVSMQSKKMDSTKSGLSAIFAFALILMIMKCSSFFSFLYLAGPAYGFACSLLLFAFLGFSDIWKKPHLCWFPLLGGISYSVYLIHFIFMDRIRHFMIPNLEIGWPRLLGSLGMGVFCLGVSYGFFVICEKRFLEKAARFKA